MPDREAKTPLMVAIQNFSSQYFLIPQGTGILTVILHQLDYQFSGLAVISYIGWIITILTLAISVVIYIIRLILFPRQTKKAIADNLAESSCLASVSIAFTTIIIMIALSLVGRWGEGWSTTAYVLWWINTAFAVLVGILIPYIQTIGKTPGILEYNPTTQLPIIAILTAGAGGGAIARFGGLSDGEAVPMIIVSFLLIGAGIPFAIGSDAIYFARLLEGRLPQGFKIFQLMILCGPWGQSSFAMQALGSAILQGAFSGYGNPGDTTIITAAAGNIVAYGSIVAGLIMWGQGTFWWIFAIIGISHKCVTDYKGLYRGGFQLTAWATVFPWGVYTNAAVELGKVLPSTAFAVWSTVLAVSLLIIWLINVAFTLRGLITGELLGLRSFWKMPLPEEPSQEEKKKNDDHGSDRSGKSKDDANSGHFDRVYGQG